MEEIELVKAARPAVADYPAADRTAARARLLAAAEPAAPDGPRPAWPGRRLPRLARRVAIAGALAIVVTAGVTLSPQLGPDGKTPIGAPSAIANAAELAHNAALAAGNPPFPYPRPHQWVYYKALVLAWRYDPADKAANDTARATGEWWVRVDRKQAAVPPVGDHPARPAPVVVVTKSTPGSPGGLATAGAPYALLPSLPTDPDELLTVVYREVERHPSQYAGGGTHQQAFNLLAAVAGELLPPDLHAALYTAIAKIPGVTVVQDASDAAGRHGVALARVEGGIRIELILDQGTYRYLGRRVVVTRDHQVGPGEGQGPVVHRGQVLSWTAQLAVAVVDAPCQRPGGTAACAVTAPGTRP